MLLSTSTGGPQGAQSTPQGAEARLGPCNTKQNGPRADSWLRTSRGAIKALRGWQGTLETQSPFLPKSPTAPQAARVAHHDFDRPGAGPPGPLRALLGPPAGAGGPTAGRCGLSEAPRGPAPLPANYDNRYKTLTTSRLPGRTKPAARPTSHFYRRSQAPPPPRGALRPRTSTRTLIGSRRALLCCPPNGGRSSSRVCGAVPPMRAHIG